jgi:hypothetical protein
MNTAMTMITDMIFVRLNMTDLLRYSSFPISESLNTSMVSGSRVGTKRSSSCGYCDRHKPLGDPSARFDPKSEIEPECYLSLAISGIFSSLLRLQDSERS